MAVVAACIVIAGLVYIAILLPMRRLTTTGATAIMAAVLAGALVVAVVVPNTAGITHLILKAGNYFSITADMQQAQAKVAADKSDVEAISHDIAKAQNDIRETCQAMFEVSFLMENVQFVLMQMPKPELLQELHNKTFALLNRCFPDDGSRDQELHKMLALSALPSPVLMAKPTPAPIR